MPTNRRLIAYRMRGEPRPTLPPTGAPIVDHRSGSVRFDGTGGHTPSGFPFPFAGIQLGDNAASGELCPDIPGHRLRRLPAAHRLQLGHGGAGFRQVDGHAHATAVSAVALAQTGGPRGAAMRSLMVAAFKSNTSCSPSLPWGISGCLGRIFVQRLHGGGDPGTAPHPSPLWSVLDQGMVNRPEPSGSVAMCFQRTSAASERRSRASRITEMRAMSTRPRRRALDGRSIPRSVFRGMQAVSRIFSRSSAVRGRACFSRWPAFLGAVDEALDDQGHPVVAGIFLLVEPVLGGDAGSVAPQSVGLLADKNPV